MKLLEGKNTIITGASRGIGNGIAKVFAQNGANVAFTYSSSAGPAEDLEKELIALGVKAKAYKSNAASFEDCQEFAKQLVNEFTKLPLPISVVKAVGKRKRSYASYKFWIDKPQRQYNSQITDDVKGGYIKLNNKDLYCKVWTEMVCCDESWGAYFLDKNTNRPIPALDRNDYYSLTTLIHELAHCLDFQYQMLYTGKPPVIAHKDYFLKSLYKILTACKDGKVKLAKRIDERAFMLQKILNTKEGKEKYFIKPPTDLHPFGKIG